MDELWTRRSGRNDLTRHIILALPVYKSVQTCDGSPPNPISPLNTPLPSSHTHRSQSNIHTSKMNFYYAHERPSAKTDVQSLVGYTSTRMFAPCQANAMPPQFQMAEAGFPSLQLDTAPRKPLPFGILEQRAQTPCRHFEHHLGWCPYGVNCHFLHDYSRLSSRSSSLAGSSGPSTCPSLASSATSSPRDSPVPSLPYYPPSSVSANLYAYPGSTEASMSRIPHHGFVPRNVGGTTYFPIRLDAARLGYVTPVGVEVFTDL